MCGRFDFHGQATSLAQLFGIEADDLELEPHYNTAPTMVTPVIANFNAAARQVRLMRFGLVLTNRMLPNVRGETVRHKFRQAFETRRALVPVNGFYEWREEKGKKQPYYFHGTNATLLALAAVYSDRPEASFALVTTEPNSVVGEIHNRMPVIVAPDGYETWLTGDVADAQALVRPYPNDAIRLHAVNSALVNTAAYDGPDCIRPIG